MPVEKPLPAATASEQERAAFLGAIDTQPGSGPVLLLAPFRARPSLREVLPAIQKRLALTSLVALALLALLTSIPVFTSFTLR